MTVRVLALDPATYTPHPVHGEGRTWAETNCYVDIWIELLHALGHDAVAALPFTFAMDFEGDQWTFFKFPLRDLADLYAIDVQELAIWRPLVRHIEEQVARGHPVLVELDSFHLPDTSGTAYRSEHVKSTVAVMDIDVDQAVLGYFHGQRFHRLSGDDFRAVLGVDDNDAGRLPPLVEFAKRRDPAPRGNRLLAISLALLERHLAFVPRDNPFTAFRERLSQDLLSFLADDLAAFHRYSFATLRQCGACFELSATYLRWLADRGERDLDAEIRIFDGISEGAKRLQFQLARAMTHRTPLDLTPLDRMAECWASATATLQVRYT